MDSCRTGWNLARTGGIGQTGRMSKELVFHVEQDEDMLAAVCHEPEMATQGGNLEELIVMIRPTVLPTPEIAALTATAEKNKMPGVMATEKELRSDEVKKLKQAGWGQDTSSQSPKSP